MAQTYTKFFFSLLSGKTSQMRKFPLTFLVLLAAVAGCNQSNKIPENFDYGIIDNDVYTNSFFGMEVPLIPGWSVQNKEEMARLMDKGAEYIGKKDKKLGEQVKASTITTANLLLMFKYAIDSASSEVNAFNASFLMLAENVAARSDIKSGTDYLDQLKKLIARTYTNFKVSPEYSVIKVGHKNFDVLKVKNITTGDVEVTQLYCCLIEKGFALVITISYSGEEQEDELRTHLNKIKFG